MPSSPEYGVVAVGQHGKIEVDSVGHIRVEIVGKVDVLLSAEMPPGPGHIVSSPDKVRLRDKQKVIVQVWVRAYLDCVGQRQNKKSNQGQVKPD